MYHPRKITHPSFFSDTIPTLESHGLAESFTMSGGDVSMDCCHARMANLHRWLGTSQTYGTFLRFRPEDRVQMFGS